MDAVEHTLATALFLVAPLVLVPLGLRLASTPARTARRPRLWRAVFVLRLPAALLLLPAFALPAGAAAAALAVPWFGFTALAALLGLLGVRDRGRLAPIEELATDAALAFLAVGGAWAVLSRLGARPLGFSDTIVLATAIHFHYAGFALCLVAGLAARALGGAASARLAAAGVIAGVPLVALGITLAALGVGWLEPIAACFLAGAGGLVALAQARVAARLDGRRAARVLLAVSSVSLAAGMALAVLYATGAVDIPVMVRYHGTVNALGFALPGLAGWVLATRGLEDSPPRALSRAASGFAGCGPPDGGLGDWERRPFAPGVERGPGPGDDRDLHEREVAVERPGDPEPDGPYRRLARAFLRFDIFPPELVTPVLRREPIEVGDTVGIRYHLVPRVVDLFFAGRVVARLDDERKYGVFRTALTSRTLAGHPELGEANYGVEKDPATGRVVVVLRSWSRPGTLLARAFAPIVRRLQLGAKRAALDHLARLAAEPRSSRGPSEEYEHESTETRKT